LSENSVGTSEGFKSHAVLEGHLNTYYLSVNGKKICLNNTEGVSGKKKKIIVTK